MTILEVVQAASPKLGIARPSQIIADTSATSLELQATIAEVAAAIRDRYDWQAFTSLGTLTGDGVALAFDKPANYVRMLKVASLWPSGSPNRPLTHIQDLNLWLGMIVQDFTAVVGAWTMLGDQFNIRMGGQSDPMALADTVQFYFINNLQFKDNANASKTAFTADTDSFRLDERLLRLGLIAKWKQDKGRPYAQDMSDFEDALAMSIGNDKGSKQIVVGNVRYPSNATIALPWSVTP